MQLRAGNSVIVVGAGVVGVATAFALARKGLKVTVLERNARPGAETSFANGAQLSYAYSESIASPESLRQLMGWMLRPDSPVILKHAPRDGAFADWVWRYLRAAMPKHSIAHSQNLLRLGMHSRNVMQQWLCDVPMEFAHQEQGILYLYRSKPDWRIAQKKLTLASAFGFTETAVRPEEIVQYEPCLADSAHGFIGAVHSAMDATGDPYLFTQSLAAHCSAALGVEFIYDITVDELIREGGEIVGAGDGVDEWRADAVVLAAGSFSPGLLAGTGLRLPVQPMKGYSITFDASDASPRSSLSDVSRRLVHTRLGNRVRVAGFAEFAGPNSAVRAEPIAQIKRDAAALVHGYGFENLTEWACLRAASTDGLPIIGATTRAGLWINTGHGMLGWTQAAGAADLLVAQMFGEAEAIPMKGYSHGRF